MKLVISDDAVMLDLTPLVDMALNWLAGQWREAVGEFQAMFTVPAPVVRKVCDLDHERWFYEVPLGGRKNFAFTYHLRHEGHEVAVSKEEYQEHARGLPGFFHKKGAMVPVHVVLPDGKEKKWLLPKHSSS